MRLRQKEIRKRQRRKDRQRKTKNRAFALTSGTGLRAVFHTKGNCLALRMRGDSTGVRIRPPNYFIERGLRPCSRCSS